MFMLAGLLGIMAAGTAAIMSFDLGNSDDTEVDTSTPEEDDASSDDLLDMVDTDLGETDTPSPLRIRSSPVMPLMRQLQEMPEATKSMAMKGMTP